jgi:hypothetical protein
METVELIVAGIVVGLLGKSWLPPGGWLAACDNALTELDFRCICVAHDS